MQHRFFLDVFPAFNNLRLSNRRANSLLIKHRCRNKSRSGGRINISPTFYRNPFRPRLAQNRHREHGIDKRKALQRQKRRQPAAALAEQKKPVHRIDLGLVLEDAGALAHPVLERVARLALEHRLGRASVCAPEETNAGLLKVRDRAATDARDAAVGALAEDGDEILEVVRRALAGVLGDAVARHVLLAHEDADGARDLDALRVAARARADERRLEMHHFFSNAERRRGGEDERLQGDRLEEVERELTEAERFDWWRWWGGFCFLRSSSSTCFVMMMVMRIILGNLCV